MKSPVPEWSCGGYVYEDASPFHFGAVESGGVVFPTMDDPGPAPLLTDDMPIATIRWLTASECPVHGASA